MYPPQAEPVDGPANLRRPAGTTAEAVPGPTRDAEVPVPVATGGERLQAIAEAAVLRVRAAENRSGSPQEEQHESLEGRALSQAATAPSQEQRDLPLWTGTDLPTGPWRTEDGVLYDAYGAPQWRFKAAPRTQPSTGAPAEDSDSPADREVDDAYESVDLRQAFTSTVAQAWADTVPPEHGTVEDLLEAVDVPLRELEELWQRAVPASPADGRRQTAAARTGHVDPVPPRRDPEPIATALRQTDTHTAVLRDLPEWQRLQTVRGATTHLWNVFRERAGRYFSELCTDLRVQGFWRTVSLRTATAIGNCAQALADRVRRGLRGGDLPTAEALLKLSDAALAYSTPGIPHPDPAGGNVEEVRQLRTTLRNGTPVPYGTREEAVHASREITEAFQVWRQTCMGRALTAASEHPRVVAFRQAWQRLPAADLPDGPGAAAGPYGDVGRSAQTLAERAEAANAERARTGHPPRFAPADVDALRIVATLAEHHGGRLAVTLPPGLIRPTLRRTPGQQTAVPSAAAPMPSTVRPVTAVRPVLTFRGPQ